MCESDWLSRLSLLWKNVDNFRPLSIAHISSLHTSIIHYICIFLLIIIITYLFSQVVVIPAVYSPIVWIQRPRKFSLWTRRSESFSSYIGPMLAAIYRMVNENACEERRHIKHSSFNYGSVGGRVCGWRHALENSGMLLLGTGITNSRHALSS